MSSANQFESIWFPDAALVDVFNPGSLLDDESCGSGSEDSSAYASLPSTEPYHSGHLGLTLPQVPEQIELPPMPETSEMSDEDSVANSHGSLRQSLSLGDALTAMPVSSAHVVKEEISSPAFSSNGSFSPASLGNVMLPAARSSRQSPPSTCGLPSMAPMVVSKVEADEKQGEVKGTKRKAAVARRKLAAELVPESDDENEDDMAGLSKKERNRKSALKYRKRRRIYMAGLEGKVSDLQHTIKEQDEALGQLSNENKVMREQVAFLKRLLASSGQPIPDLGSVSSPSSSATSATPKSAVVLFAIFACFLLIPMSEQSLMMTTHNNLQASSTIVQAPSSRVGGGRVLMQARKSLCVDCEGLFEEPSNSSSPSLSFFEYVEQDYGTCAAAEPVAHMRSMCVA